MNAKKRCVLLMIWVCITLFPASSGTFAEAPLRVPVRDPLIVQAGDCARMAPGIRKTDSSGILAFSEEGQWVEYDLTVERAGIYSFVFQTSSRSRDDGLLTLQSPGRDLSAQIAIPRTSSATAYTDTEEASLFLEEGAATIRLQAAGPGSFAVESFRLAYRNVIPSRVSLIAIAASVEYSEKARFAAVISSELSIPGGSVIFYVDDVKVKEVPIERNGIAVLEHSGIPVGSHTVSALYPGSGNYGASVSAQISFDVVKGTPVLDETLIPKDLAAIYGDTLESVILPENFRWMNPHAAVGDANPAGQICYAVYNPDPRLYTDILVPLNITVAAKPIAIQPEAKTVFINETDPGFNIAVLYGMSFEPGDREKILASGSLTYESDALGVYDIVQASPYTNPNYDITFVPGSVTLIETKAMQTFRQVLNSVDENEFGQADADAVARAYLIFTGLDKKEISGLGSDMTGAFERKVLLAKRANHTHPAGRIIDEHLPWYVRMSFEPFSPENTDFAAVSDVFRSAEIIQGQRIRLTNTITGLEYVSAAPVDVELFGEMYSRAGRIAVCSKGVVEAFVEPHYSDGTLRFSAANSAGYVFLEMSQTRYEEVRASIFDESAVPEITGNMALLPFVLMGILLCTAFFNVIMRKAQTRRYYRGFATNAPGASRHRRMIATTAESRQLSNSPGMKMLES